jgi:quercetin dioxygenase-like cupin family protein
VSDEPGSGTSPVEAPGVRLRPSAVSDDADAVEAALAAEGLYTARWGNGPGYRYAEHDHPYGKVLVCVRGGIVFHTAPTGDWALHPGDRLELAAGVVHSATVGDQGVECVEAHRP